MLNVSANFMTIELFSGQVVRLDPKFLESPGTYQFHLKSCFSLLCLKPRKKHQ